MAVLLQFIQSKQLFTLSVCLWHCFVVIVGARSILIIVGEQNVQESAWFFTRCELVVVIVQGLCKVMLSLQELRLLLLVQICTRCPGEQGGLHRPLQDVGNHLHLGVVMQLHCHSFRQMEDRHPQKRVAQDGTDSHSLPDVLIKLKRNI